MMNRFKSKEAYRWGTLTAMGMLGLVIGILFTNTLSKHGTALDMGTGSGLPIPANRQELVQKADVIVVGRVGQVVRQGEFAGYAADGTLIRPESADPRIRNPALPFYDLEIKVERIIKDDGVIRSGKPLLLRMSGVRTAAQINPQDDFPMSSPGDRHLFFLSRNPDNETYGLYFGAWSRLNIDGPIVTASDGGHSTIPFIGRTAPSDFIDQLESKP